MNYPGGIKARKISETKQNISYKNRGMNLEDDLNTTNNYYREKGVFSSIDATDEVEATYALVSQELNKVNNND